LEERKKGLFIVFEGIDGSGKTTLIEMLKDVLEQQTYSIVVLKEPTNETDAGKKIRESYVTGRVPFEEELQWFIDDREWNVNTNIKPALEAKSIILQDRYFFSTVCYQGVRNNNDWSSIIKLNRSKFPEPDLTIVIDVEPKLALERITKDRVKENSFEALENLRNVRNLFLEVINNDPIGNYLLIDGSDSLEEISEEIQLNLYLLIENLNPQLQLVAQQPLKSKDEEST
jgi:dTMP kinase